MSRIEAEQILRDAPRTIARLEREMNRGSASFISKSLLLKQGAEIINLKAYLHEAVKVIAGETPPERVGPAVIRGL